MLGGCTRFKNSSKLKTHKFSTRSYREEETPRKVTLIPGDGLGPEITGAVAKIFDAADVPIQWDYQRVLGRKKDSSYFKQTTNLIQPETHNSILKNKVVLKGPFFAPIGYGHTSIDKVLALQYDLFAQVAQCKGLYMPRKVPYPNLNLVVIRETTEAEYSGVEHEVVPGVVESIKVVTREKSSRIAKFAFDYAKKHHYERVYSVHKASIMKETDGLFITCCREASEEYPNIEYKELIVDNTAMQLVNNPAMFDRSVIVTTNLYGSIVANIGASLVGGPGVVGGFDYGPDVKVFEQGARHVGADIAGRNLANPVGLIRSAITMLEHLQLPQYAVDIQRALDRTLYHGEVTYDLGGNLTTSEFTNAVISRLENTSDV